ncbi:hypothetical protein RJT34_06872 [Clitoria ternatea]|uniref:Prephenate dehydratase domain-containing protein n=1 Tax=Clitoria ternatea TaxID=43366 RepID=A0AAN9K4K1_CLITE
MTASPLLSLLPMNLPELFRALAPIEDEKKPIFTEVESSGGDKFMVLLNELKEFHKDDLPPTEWWGLTGAYSKDAALKAYPNCETVPCDEFETIFKAFIQCEMMLNDLCVVKVGTHDTSTSAKIVASNRKRDTTAIASSRAGKIYGLDLLLEGFQVKLSVICFVRLNCYTQKY